VSNLSIVPLCWRAVEVEVGAEGQMGRGRDEGQRAGQVPCVCSWEKMGLRDHVPTRAAGERASEQPHLGVSSARGPTGSRTPEEERATRGARAAPLMPRAHAARSCRALMPRAHASLRVLLLLDLSLARQEI